MRLFGHNHLPVFAAEAGSGSSGTTSQTPSGTSAPAAASAAPSAAPTPASAPSPAPSGDTSGSSGAGDVASGSESLDFMTIFEGGMEESETPAPKAPSTPAATEKPVAAEAPKAQPGAEPAPKPEAPKPATDTPATAAPSPTGADSSATSPSLDPSDPASLARALSENEAAAIEHVASTYFKLSNEEVEALETDAVGTIPKLLARGFVRAQHNMLMQLSRLVPQMVLKTSEAARRNGEGEDKFFSRWPDLDKAKHLNTVRSLGVEYRRRNPNATLEQMVESLGPVVMIAAGVTPTLRPAAPASGVPAPNGSRPPQPAPFVPAMSGPGASSTGDDRNEIEVMFDPRNE